MGDSTRTCLTICGVICFLVISLPLGITSIVLSQTEDDACDYTDQLGLDIKQYLLGGGIASVVVASLIALFGLMSLCIDEFSLIPIGITIVLNILFGIAWFIIGACILFRSNIECIKEGSVPVIYALVLWCLSASSLFIV
ncbi:putative ORFan [Tupanvirus deep ocean]|uniref:ORFan n=2 Tax=Tupanvirus TaxID=2094720 RepID=A0AC62A9N6_9VIRU|nr:putative ORFan [Tupanvirus deep ocean]QKU34484.1 putative ORFan [Tupanvirus deep ocean]